MIQMELFKISPEQKKKTIEKLIESSSPTPSFFLALILSVIIATFGILINNTAVVIGGMLVSPLLSPILAITLGIVISDFKLIYRSIYVLAKAVIWTLVVAFIMSLFVVNKELNNEIISRITPSLVYFIIALASGIAAAFALSKQEFAERLVGVAVAIALLPPLVVIGIGMAFLNWGIIVGSLGLFLTNLFGILLGALIIFSLLRFYPEKKVVQQELKEEEQEFEKAKNNHNNKKKNN